MLNSFVKMKNYGDRFYFGFSAAINLRSPKTSDVIKLVLPLPIPVHTIPSLHTHTHHPSMHA